VAVAEEAIDDAEQVAAKVERAATLFTKVVRGEIDIATITDELERLFTLLVGLERAGRYREALRLARVLARLLALGARLVALVETLRIAVGAAKALGDTKALGWALHELGTLALGAEDAEAAERDLGGARRLREQAGDRAGLAATEHNLRYVGRRGLLGSRALRVGAGAVALALALVLVVVVAGDDDDPGSDHDGTDTGTTQTTSGDETPPSVTLATAALTNQRAPALTGSAGTDEGDSPDVRVRIYEGGAATGDPLQDRPATRAGDGSFQVDAEPLTSGTYTAQAAQSDDAGNTGRSDPVTFTVDLEPPVVTIATPAKGEHTSEEPEFTGTAGQAEGDEATVTVTVSPAAGSTEAQDGSWSLTLAVTPVFDNETKTYTPMTATAEQRDEAGNVGTATVEFVPEQTTD
jgi:hypothetical protein